MDIFCKIINNEIPSEKIFEDDFSIAIMDLYPKRPGHFLVIPKKHSTNLIDIDDEDFLKSVAVAKKLANKKIKEMGVSGFNLIVNSGAEAKQEVFHTHIHIIPSIK